jgi:hypothetical protein
MALDTSSHSPWNRFFARYSDGTALAARPASRFPRKVKSTRELSTSAAMHTKRPAAVKSEADWEECTKRLRRLVLIEGVPNDEVSLRHAVASL